MKRVVYFLFVGLILTACNNTPVTLPTVTTGDAQIFYNTSTATCSGEVTDNGGGKITERGICYAQGTITPEASGLHVSAGSGTGLFFCSLPNVTAGRWTYRAYATNEAGTAYGEAKSFIMDNESGNPENPDNPDNPDNPTPANITIDDYVGSWKVEEQVYTNGEWVSISYSSANIEYYDDGLVFVDGLYGEFDGKYKNLDFERYFSAWGIWDETNKCIRIFGGWVHSERTFTYSGNDTTYYVQFAPIEFAESGEGYYNIGLDKDDNLDDDDIIIENGDTLGWGEARLVMNEKKQIVCTSALKPSSRGYYANAAKWMVVNSITGKSIGTAFARDIVLTERISTSASMPAAHGRQIQRKAIYINPQKLQNNESKNSIRVPYRLNDANLVR